MAGQDKSKTGRFQKVAEYTHIPRKICGRFHALRLFVADLKLIYNFCGRLHELRLCLGRFKAHS